MNDPKKENQNQFDLEKEAWILAQRESLIAAGVSPEKANAMGYDELSENCILSPVAYCPNCQRLRWHSHDCQSGRK